MYVNFQKDDWEFVMLNIWLVTEFWNLFLNFVNLTVNFGNPRKMIGNLSCYFKCIKYPRNVWWNIGPKLRCSGNFGIKVQVHSKNNLLLKLICHSLQEGLDRAPCKVTGQVVISSTQLSVNIRKRGSWGTNGHRLGIVCYIEGASSYR